MDDILGGMKIAVLVTDGFEQVELTGPCEALQEAGANPSIISVKKGQVQGFNHDEKADRFNVALSFDEADPEDFDAVLLPGGVFNGDQIRMVPQARQFVQEMQAAGKPIAAICHAPWLLVSAGLVRDRSITSWPSLQDDIRNAGGKWTDQEVVVDGNLVTSRKPADIPAFNQKLLELLSERFSHRMPGKAAERQPGLSG